MAIMIHASRFLKFFF